MKTSIVLAALAAAWTLSTPIVASAAPVAAAAAPGAVVLKMGTPIPLKTTTELTSKKVKTGDRFALTVAQDVVVDGRTVIPAGTSATGEVTRVVKKGAFGRSGKIDTRLLYADVGSTRVPLTGQSDSAGKGGTTGTVAAAIAVGVFSAFVTGKSAVIAPGTEMIGYTAGETTLPAR